MYQNYQRLASKSLTELFQLNRLGLLSDIGLESAIKRKFIDVANSISSLERTPSKAYIIRSNDYPVIPLVKWLVDVVQASYEIDDATEFHPIFDENVRYEELESIVKAIAEKMLKACKEGKLKQGLISKDEF